MNQEIEKTEKLRTIERITFSADGVLPTFTKIRMNELKVGDVFRMFDDNSELVISKTGQLWLTCNGEPYEMINENNVKTWAVQCKD